MDFSEAQRAARARATRVYYTVQSQPSWVTKLSLSLALFVFVSVVLLLVIPALVVGLVVFLIAGTIAGIKRRILGLRAPNGPLDGRENVRVITRDTDRFE